ncbi:hypothetical protein [Ferriphaselus sp. R-1]|nr:hypothetical protein [Ferriphaselus sp. R-1]
MTKLTESAFEYFAIKLFERLGDNTIHTHITLDGRIRLNVALDEESA